MKAVGHRGVGDHVNVSFCHWQQLKTHHAGSKRDSDDHSPKEQRLPRSRQRHSACRVGEFVYVFCGKDGTSPLKDIWKYNIYHQTWDMVKLRGGSLPLLQGHTTVAYKRLIVIFGGTFNNNVNDIQLWIFNTDLGHLREVWGEAGAAQPLCRRDHSAVMHNNLMYVFGGFKDPTGATQELWAFNIDEEEWTELTHLSHCRPSGRYGHTAVVADNAMWIFGGTAGLSPCADFWKYSFSLHQWTKLKCVGAPQSLSGHSTCVIHHQMIVVGGTCKGKPVNDAWSYRFDTNTWQKLNTTGMQLPGLSLHTCVPVGSFDGRNQRSTDRAVSTPHLKPSTSLLHPDRFLVRPRTSPSTLEDTAPHGFRGDGHEGSGAQNTQLLSFEESESTAIELGNFNSNSKADPRIDVSLKEPLVSDSPGSVGFYDSCVPFSARCNDGSTQELQVLQNATQGSDSETGGPDVTAGPGEWSQKTATVDLIDLSDSPVLKTAKHCAMLRKEVTFWNDLFVEDLETSDDGGLDEVKISYPSKNHVLPSQCPVIMDTDGLSIIEDTSTEQWRNEKSSREQTNDNLWSRNGQNSSENQNISRVGELQGFGSNMNVKPTPLSKCAPSQTQRVQSRLQSETGNNSGFFTKPEESHLLPVNKDMHSRVQRDRSKSLPVNQDADVSLPGHKRPDQDRIRNTSGCEPDSVEAETSFIDIRDSAPSRLTASSNGGVVSGHAFSGGSLATANNRFTASSSASRTKVTGGRAGGCVQRIKAAGDCAKEEMVPEEPFLLLLGGKMEEQIRIHPSPIAVWKGTFA